MQNAWAFPFYIYKLNEDKKMKNRINFAWVLLGSLAGAFGAYLLSSKRLKNNILHQLEEDAGEAVQNAICKYGEDRIRQTIEQKLSNDVVNTIRENCESKLEKRIFADIKNKAKDSLDSSVKNVVESIAHDDIDQEVKYKLASSNRMIEEAIRNTTNNQVMDILSREAKEYAEKHMGALLKKEVEQYFRALSFKDLDVTIREIIYEKANDIFDSKVQAYIDRYLRSSIQNAIDRRFQNFQSEPVLTWKGGSWPSNLI